MPIPKPSQTKQPILKYLAKAGKPVKKAAITETMGKHFNLTKKEMEETSLKGSKRFQQCIIAATKEMKAAGLVRSRGHGYLAITAQGLTGLQEGTVIDGRKKPGSKAKAKSPANGRKKRGRPGRPPKVKAKNGRRKPGRPKAQAKASTNGRRKLGRPKMQPAKQPSIPATKADDKMVQRTADIVRSYVEKNSVRAKEVPSLIQSIYGTLSGLGSSSKPVAKRKYTRRKKVAKKS